jgi:tetratricopeptide (TPR) repeat protein
MVLLAAAGLAAPAQEPKKPLTKDQVLGLVKGSVPSARVADLVGERGIDFEPTEEYLSTLQSAGAEVILLDALRAARPRKPPVPDATAEAKRHIKEANAVLESGDIDGAIALYQAAIRASPVDAEAHRLLGIAYGKKKDWQRDIAEQRAALLLDPADEAAKAELTAALRSATSEPVTTEDSRAKTVIKPPAQDNAALAQQAFATGQLQFEQRKFEAAAISFSEATQLRPDWADPFVERAKVYMKLYLFREAIHSYDQAVKLRPNDPLILNLRGYAHYSASEFQPAIADLDEAIRLEPNLAEAYQNRGNAKWQMGDRAGANADFERAKMLEAGTSPQSKTRRRK